MDLSHEVPDEGKLENNMAYYCTPLFGTVQLIQGAMIEDFN